MKLQRLMTRSKRFRIIFMSAQIKNKYQIPKKIHKARNTYNTEY